MFVMCRWPSSPDCECPVSPSQIVACAHRRIDRMRKKCMTRSFSNRQHSLQCNDYITFKGSIRGGVYFTYSYSCIGRAQFIMPGLEPLSYTTRNLSYLFRTVAQPLRRPDSTVIFPKDRMGLYTSFLKKRRLNENFYQQRYRIYIKTGV